MTSGWVAREEGVVRSFPAEEREVLSSLATGLDDTLALAGRVEGDAVLDRLFPRAYDAALGDAADEFAAHTRERMADGKRVRLARVMSDLDAVSGERVVLDRDAAQAWLLVLNDMRLALAERIGPERVDDPLVGPVGDVYAWLGWLQAGLLDEIAAVR